MSDSRPLEGPEPEDRGWRGATVLLGVVFFASVTNPAVLLSIPLLLLAGLRGVRGVGGFAAIALAMLVVASGLRDGVWYMERAWALLLGGGFVALSIVRPMSKPSSRALAAVLGAAGASAGLLALRAGAWSVLDWAIADRVLGGVAVMLDYWVLLREGEALAPALVASVYDMAEAQLAVFPAITGLASMAALCVAWWAHARLTATSGRGLGRLKDFRFNDHLVWVFVGGLALLVTSLGDPLARVGSNAVVFMGALYALRGAAVVVFMSGGVSLIGFAVSALGLVLVPRLFLGGALLIGLGDVWLDVRGRVAELTA